MTMGPLGIILFILAGIYVSKRTKLSSLTAADFPTVAPDGFEEWRRLELRSIDVFLCVTAALFLMGIVGSIAMSVVSPSGRDPSPGVIVAFVVFGAAYILTFLVGLTVSAIIGSRAARLKKSLGINWSGRQ